MEHTTDETGIPLPYPYSAMHYNLQIGNLLEIGHHYSANNATVYLETQRRTGAQTGSENQQ